MAVTGTGTSTTTALASAAAEDGKSADVGTGADTQGTSEGASPAPAAGAPADVAAAELSKPFTDAKQLPAELKVDEAVLKEFLPLAQKHGLTAGQAAALLAHNADAAKKSEEARAAAQEAAAAKAVEALKKDAEIGGARFEASMKLAGAALRKFGGAADAATGKSPIVEAFSTLELADGSMLGDNPVIARFLVNVGKALAEDQVGAHRAGSAVKTAVNDTSTFHSQLYPNSPELHAAKKS